MTGQGLLRAFADRVALRPIKINAMKNFNRFSLLAAGMMLVVAGLEFSGCKKGPEDPALSLSSRKARLTGTWTVTMYGDTMNFEGTYDNSSSDSDGWSYNSSREMISTTYTNYDGVELSQITMEESSDSYSSNGFGSSSSEEMEVVMENGEVTISSTQTYSSGGSTDVYSFDADGDYEGTASMTYTFNGDGTFTATSTMKTAMDITYVESGSTISEENTEAMSTSISGTWAFIGGNKQDGYANKERIALWYKTMDETTESTYGGTYFSWNYTYDESEESEDSWAGSETDPDETWVLVMLKGKEMKVRRTYSFENTYMDFYNYSDNDPYNESDDYEYNGIESGSTTMMLTQD